MEESEREAYMEEHAAAYPSEYLAGIDLYNAGEFHAAHDAWEERWRDDCGPQEKLFLQAMIQSAVIFHHIEIGRRGAARRMYRMALEKFERLGASRFMSLDVDDYLAQLARSLSWLDTTEDPRDALLPTDFEPPRIRLLSGADEYD
jgi:predicted metal-dependent hydrolase